MRCPFCYHQNTIVKDSRVADESKIIRRRRLCENCSAKFSTYERPQLRELYVIKRSGIRKAFDRSKIYNSIATAIRKRQAGEQQIEQIVGLICGALESNKDSAVPTRKIGDMILTELAKIDEVAYIRFASVYKDFTSTQDFVKLINLMSKNKT